MNRKPGFYWYRDRGERQPEWEVVQVRQFPVGLVVEFQEGSRFEMGMLPGEFIPIPEPDVFQRGEKW